MLALDVETNGTDLDGHLPVLQFGWAHDEPSQTDGGLPERGVIDAVLGPEYASPIACCVHGVAPHLRTAEDPRPNVRTPLGLAVEMLETISCWGQSSDPGQTWGYNSDRFDSRVIRSCLLDAGLASSASVGQMPRNDLMALLQAAHWLQSHPDPAVRLSGGLSLPLNSSGRPMFSLSDVARHLGMEFEGEAHTADADAHQTLRVAQRLAPEIEATMALLEEERLRAREMLEDASQSPDAPQPVGFGMVGQGFAYSTGYRLATMAPTAKGGYPAWKTTDPKGIKKLLGLDLGTLQGVMALPEDERKAVIGASPPIGVLYPGLMRYLWDRRAVLPKKRRADEEGLKLLEKDPARAQLVMELLFSEGTHVRHENHPRRWTPRSFGLSMKDAVRLESHAYDMSTQSMQELFAFSPFGAAGGFDLPPEGRAQVGRKLTDLKWRQILSAYPAPMSRERMLGGLAALVGNAPEAERPLRWLEADSWLRSLRDSLPACGAESAGMDEVARAGEKGDALLFGKSDMLKRAHAHNRGMDALASFTPPGPSPFHDHAEGKADSLAAQVLAGEATVESCFRIKDALKALEGGASSPAHENGRTATAGGPAP